MIPPVPRCQAAWLCEVLRGGARSVRRWLAAEGGIEGEPFLEFVAVIGSDPRNVDDRLGCA